MNNHSFTPTPTETGLWSRLTLFSKLLLLSVLLGMTIGLATLGLKPANGDEQVAPPLEPAKLERLEPGVVSKDTAPTTASDVEPGSEAMAPLADTTLAGSVAVSGDVKAEDDSSEYDQPEAEQRVETSIQRGDHLERVLQRLDVTEPEVLIALRRRDVHQAMSRLSAGGVAVLLRRDGQVESLLLPLTRGEFVVLQHTADGFDVQIGHARDIASERKMRSRVVEISHSLFASARSAGVPETVTDELVRALGSQVDFSRLQAGDQLRVVFETYAQDTVELGQARLMAAQLDSGRHKHAVFRHQPKQGQEAFYTAAGEPVNRGFLRYPLEFKRISGQFGMRQRHPVFGDRRMHRGTDFAAPSGTPIMAASDGRVKFSGWKGGYGNTVVISHANGVETLYAHLSRFAVQQGALVKQGQRIGFVGDTGTATGPHLHYEIHIAGRAQDPMTVALPMRGPALKNEALSAFKMSIEPYQLALQDVKTVTAEVARAVTGDQAQNL